jgi:hypothetical protein
LAKFFFFFFLFFFLSSKRYSIFKNLFSFEGKVIGDGEEFRYATPEDSSADLSFFNAYQMRQVFSYYDLARVPYNQPSRPHWLPQLQSMPNLLPSDVTVLSDCKISGIVFSAS